MLDLLKASLALMIASMLVMLTALVLDGTTVAASGATAARASCNHPSPFDTAPGIGGPEVIGSGSGAQLWGLIMVPRFPPVASKAVVKIVWRMTGAGPLKQVGYSFHGKSLRLVWGPELHGGSNYARPGIELGGWVSLQNTGLLSADRAPNSRKRSCLATHQALR